MSLDRDFAAYCGKHGKEYQDEEEYEKRKSLFEEMDQFIQDHNSSGARFTLRHNRLSDLTKEERANKLGLRN